MKPDNVGGGGNRDEGNGDGNGALGVHLPISTQKGLLSDIKLDQVRKHSLRSLLGPVTLSAANIVPFHPVAAKIVVFRNLTPFPL